MGNIDTIPRRLRRIACEKIAEAVEDKFRTGDYPHIRQACFDIEFDAGKDSIRLKGRVVVYCEESGGDGRDTPRETVSTTETEIFEFTCRNREPE